VSTPLDFPDERRSSHRAAVVVFVLTLVALGTWAFWPRSPETDEARIRAVVEAAALGAERRNVGAVLLHVSETYRGEGGERAGLGLYLAAWFRTSAELAVFTRVPELHVAGDAAEGTVEIRSVRAPAGGGPADNDGIAGSRRVAVRFARENGVWRVTHARLAPE